MLTVKLDYLRQSHEFSLKVSNVKTVSYTLVYSFDREVSDAQGAIKLESVTEALTGQGSGDHLYNYFVKSLAGTESNDQRVLHNPRQGALEILATDTVDQALKYQATFLINDKSQLEIISQSQVSAKNGQVAGVSTGSANLDDEAANSKFGLANTKAESLAQTNQVTAQTASSTGLPLTQSPLLMGGSLTLGLAILGGGGWWWLRHRRLKNLHVVNSGNAQET